MMGWNFTAEALQNVRFSRIRPDCYCIVIVYIYKHLQPHLFEQPIFTALRTELGRAWLMSSEVGEG